MFSRTLFVVTTAAVVVNAHWQSYTVTSPATSPSAAPSVSACVLACIAPAAMQNGCDTTNYSCLCTSAQFLADVSGCITAHCPAADFTAALALQTAKCNAAGLSATGAATPKSVSFTAPSPAPSATYTTTSSVASTYLPATTTKAAATSYASASMPAASSASSSAPSAASAASTASRASATPSASKAAAESVLANGAGALFGALLAGVLAL